ncbi:hypothetical protein PHLCEN_2v3250 [Hermanssonia centrifuga]|uniref:Mannan endo-1,6-alpha-mannosidase n=1 Tax=Hermanssonia centrifuga TaxID=98765 RepID=A0A2R6QXM1_9APHY|nr:hypothetical protein PHLCEN_2v3250 [Hermanssonia centrifuga]
MLTIDSTDVISQSDNTDGLQSTVSKWSASNTTPTNPTPPSTTVGCASLQTPAKMDFGLTEIAEMDDYDDLIEIQTIVPNKDNGDDHVLPVTSSFIPQLTSGTAPNTITSHLFFSLTVALTQYSDPDGTLRSWADKAAAWYTTGKGQTLRDTDGLWFDGTNSSCNAPDHHKWTYNQGPILSALGAMANLTGDNSYIDFALTTLDGVVNSPGTPSLPQTENGNNFLEIVNGNLAEWCDGASSSTCNNDQQYFKVGTLFCINPDCYF